MKSRGLEVADIFRAGRDEYLKQHAHTITAKQRQVINAIIACRTSVLGGHVHQCDRCGRQQISYNSCRNRHCPKCQAMARAAWTEAREAELLPVPYFHVVFTLPGLLSPLALQNQRFIYGILFKAVSETMKEVAANPKHLGADIGFLAVLHTWGQSLMHHPHIHCVATGGGIASDGSRWIHCKASRKRKPFFAPVRILSRVFRGKFIGLLKQAFHSGKLTLKGRLSHLQSDSAFETLLGELVQDDWVVHAKRPFGGPKQVLRYLARYTHRVAISNQRLIDVHNGSVRFRWKDYADASKNKTMELDIQEFMRRFLLHVLPTGFVRIRHYGFLANRNRNERLARCRQLLGASSCISKDDEPSEPCSDPGQDEACAHCPVCREGRLVVIRTLTRYPPHSRPRPHYKDIPNKVAVCDSS